MVQYRYAQITLKEDQEILKQRPPQVLSMQGKFQLKYTVDYRKLKSYPQVWVYQGNNESRKDQYLALYHCHLCRPLKLKLHILCIFSSHLPIMLLCSLTAMIKSTNSKMFF